MFDKRWIIYQHRTVDDCHFHSPEQRRLYTAGSVRVTVLHHPAHLCSFTDSRNLFWASHLPPPTLIVSLLIALPTPCSLSPLRQ